MQCLQNASIRLKLHMLMIQQNYSKSNQNIFCPEAYACFKNRKSLNSCPNSTDTI